MKIRKLLVLTSMVATSFALQFANTDKAEARIIINQGTEDYCREYTQTFAIGNEIQKGYGTACLQPDGSWQIQQDAAQPQQSFNYVVRDRYVYVRPPRPFITLSLGSPRYRYDNHNWNRGHHNGHWH